MGQHLIQELHTIENTAWNAAMSTATSGAVRDEETIRTGDVFCDPDRDGVVDFDEVTSERFGPLSLDPRKKDTDENGKDDKQEIMEHYGVPE